MVSNLNSQLCNPDVYLLGHNRNVPEYVDDKDIRCKRTEYLRMLKMAVEV